MISAPPPSAPLTAKFFAVARPSEPRARYVDAAPPLGILPRQHGSNDARMRLSIYQLCVPHHHLTRLSLFPLRLPQTSLRRSQIPKRVLPGLGPLKHENGEFSPSSIIRVSAFLSSIELFDYRLTTLHSVRLMRVAHRYLPIAPFELDLPFQIPIDIDLGLRELSHSYPFRF